MIHWFSIKSQSVSFDHHFQTPTPATSWVREHSVVSLAVSVFLPRSSSCRMHSRIFIWAFLGSLLCRASVSYAPFAFYFSSFPLAVLAFLLLGAFPVNSTYVFFLSEKGCDREVFLPIFGGGCAVHLMGEGLRWLRASCSLPLPARPSFEWCNYQAPLGI